MLETIPILTSPIREHVALIDKANLWVDTFTKNRRSVIHNLVDSASAYDELSKSIDECDLFFAFPWPGEQEYFAKVFDSYAADGSLLLTYNGINGLRLQRRVG